MTKINIASAATPIEVSDPSMLVAKPLVSVLMMAFNHGSYIAQAIESVLHQCPEFTFELLIGEDHSADCTGEVVMRYQRLFPGVIRVITAECNVGVYENYRRLLMAGRGKYFAHLDGDDYWLPGKLNRQVRFLHEHSGCVAVYTNAITVNHAGERIGVFNDVQTEEFDISVLVRRGNFLNTSSMVFRAALRGSLLDIDRMFIDYQTHLRLARAGSLVQLGESLAVYRVDSASSMLTGTNDLVRRAYWQALMDVPRNLVSDEDFAGGLADFLRRTAFRALRVGRLDLLCEWVPRVMAAAPCGRLAMTRMTMISVAEQILLALRGLIVLGPDNRRAKVLYRRGAKQ